MIIHDLCNLDLMGVHADTHCRSLVSLEWRRLCCSAVRCEETVPFERRKFDYALLGLPFGRTGQLLRQHGIDFAVARHHVRLALGHNTAKVQWYVEDEGMRGCESHGKETTWNNQDD